MYEAAKWRTNKNRICQYAGASTICQWTAVTGAEIFEVRHTMGLQIYTHSMTTLKIS